MRLRNSAGRTHEKIDGNTPVWRDTFGSACTEYALISALVGAVLSVSLGLIGSELEDQFQRLGNTEAGAVHVDVQGRASEPVEPLAR